MTSRRWDRGRRPRGAGPLNIQGTLGTLLRTTLHQMGVVKDAVERQARSSLGQIDAVMLQRRHREALARLGEVVWDLARHGELGELGEHEEIAALLDELAELDDRAQQSAEPGDGTVSAADWTPEKSRPAPARGPAGPRTAAGPRAADRKNPPEMRVWRPSVADIADAPEAPDDAEATDVSPAQERARTAARSRGRRPRGRDGQAAGGIAFMDDGPGDEDDDLAGYMHEDDVPPRE